MSEGHGITELAEVFPSDSSKETRQRSFGIGYGSVFLLCESACMADGLFFTDWRKYSCASGFSEISVICSKVVTQGGINSKTYVFYE